MRSYALALALASSVVLRGDGPSLPRSGEPDHAAACEPSSAVVCNTIKGKLPSAARSLEPPSFSSGLAAPDAQQLERLLAAAFSELPIVDAVTAHFFGCLARFIVGASTASPEDALVLAFGSGSRANTGYAGGELETLRAVLSAGNSRERWALAYVLQKNRYADALFARAAADPPLARALGLGERALGRRARELRLTRERVAPAERASNGISDWLFPPFSSWVRFDFDSPPPREVAANATGGSSGWVGCRRLRPSGCLGTQLRSDDPSLRPPLSDREVAYQCRGAPPCRLLWQPGASCYTLLDTPIGGLAGYAARAHRLGYGAVAGVSGTTANTLQLGALLGADEAELLLLRLAMLGWLVLSGDHSVWEVLLAAEPFVPAALRVGELRAGQPALCLLGRLLPPELRWREHALRAADAWAAVVAELEPSAAWAALGSARRAYLSCLASARDPESCCAGPLEGSGGGAEERHGEPIGVQDHNPVAGKLLVDGFFGSHKMSPARSS